MLKKKNNCYEKTTACHQKKFHNPHYHSEQVCEIIISSNDKQRKGIKAFAFNQLCNCLIESHVLNPLSPSNIHIQILHTEIFTFHWRISWENLKNDHIINSHSLSYWLSIDNVTRKLMLVTLKTWRVKQYGLSTCRQAGNWSAAFLDLRRYGYILCFNRTPAGVLLWSGVTSVAFWVK